MACYHPLKGFQIGLTENGKPKYKVCEYEVLAVQRYDKDGCEPRFFKVYESGVELSSLRSEDSGFRPTQQISYFVELPCGRCIGCRLDYSRRWADRMMLELQCHSYAWFITLTYDNDHVPYTVKDSTGELGAFTLSKRDFQLFMKRLRKHSGDDLRYFAAGEYGSKTFRPHFHMILYGLVLWDEDLEFYKKDPSGKFSYYKCPWLESIWKNGMVVVSKVTWETCAYTARYTAKKAMTMDKEFWLSNMMEPPFTLMSRKPGIGKPYYDTHPGLFDYNKISISTRDGGKEISIPRYFDDLLEVESEKDDLDLEYRSFLSSLHQQRKDIRQRLAVDYKASLLKQTDLSWEDYLCLLESNKLDSVKKLKREL